MNRLINALIMSDRAGVKTDPLTRECIRQLATTDYLANSGAYQDYIQKAEEAYYGK